MTIRDLLALREFAEWVRVHCPRARPLEVGPVQGYDAPYDAYQLDAVSLAAARAAIVEGLMAVEFQPLRVGLGGAFSSLAFEVEATELAALLAEAGRREEFLWAETADGAGRLLVEHPKHADGVGPIWVAGAGSMVALLNSFVRGFPGGDRHQSRSFPGR